MIDALWSLGKVARRAMKYLKVKAGGAVIRYGPAVWKWAAGGGPEKIGFWAKVAGAAGLGAAGFLGSLAASWLWSRVKKTERLAERYVGAG